MTIGLPYICTVRLWRLGRRCCDAAQLTNATCPFTATVIIGTAGKAVDRVEQRVEMMNDEQKRCVWYFLMR